MKRGATLVEILIVIGIIAILAGIMFFATGGTRESARQAGCMSNLKQIYLAWSLYSADHPGNPVNPHAPDMTEIPDLRIDWLYPYAKSPDVWYCPSAQPWMRQRMASTYQFAISRPTQPLERIAREKMYSEQGAQADAVICRVHEEVYYQPRRSIEDDKRVGATLIVLDFTGATRLVRRPGFRTQTFSMIGR